MKKSLRKTDPLLNRVPPHDIDAEEIVLGAVFGIRGSISEVREMLKPEDFYKGGHKKIFAAILECPSEEGTIDIVVVADKLKSKDELESIGGVAYLAHLMDEIPMVSSIRQYAEIIFRCSVKRLAIIKASEIIEAALKDDVELDVFMTEVEDLIADVEKKSFEGKGVENLDISLDDLFDNDSPLLRTPHELLNNEIQGYGPGELTIIGAKSGMGKTAFCLGQLIHTVTVEERSVIYCAAQMDKKRIFMRILAQMCEVNFRKMWASRQFPREKIKQMHTAHKAIAEGEFIKYIIEKEELSLPDLKMRVGAEIKRSSGKIALVFIENLQQLFIPGKTFRNGFEKASFMIKELKPWVSRMNVATIVSSQLNREVDKREDPRPRPTDIFGKDAEELSDNIWLLYRPDVHKKKVIDGSEDDQPEQNAEIILGKGTKPVSIPMAFLGPPMKWIPRK